MAARSSPDLDDPRLAGMHSVGIFVCRARGEVFLTDDDLGRFESAQGLVALVVAGGRAGFFVREEDGSVFESAQGLVALVVAGGRAGFFVREKDGSVQAVRSHEEFLVANVAAARMLEPAPELPAAAPKRALKRAMTGTGLLCLPVAVLAYLQPLLPQPPISLAVREDAGQLMVGWNAHLKTEGGLIEIADGPDRTTVPLAPGQTGVTYSHHAGEVQIRLVAGTREGSAHWSASHYVASVPAGSSEASVAGDDVLKLEREAIILRTSLERSKSRRADLSRRIDKLLAR
jgi:hypothetical protein